MRGTRDKRYPHSEIIWNPSRIGRFKPDHLELALQLEWAVATHTDYVKYQLITGIKSIGLVVVVLRQSDLDDQESYCREPIALMSCDVEGRGKRTEPFG